MHGRVQVHIEYRLVCPILFPCDLNAISSDLTYSLFGDETRAIQIIDRMNDHEPMQGGHLFSVTYL